MATATDGRVYASENGVPIYSSVENQFNGFYARMNKSAGSMGYGTVGAVNTIFGQFVSAVVFASDNAYTAQGVKQWDKSGMRVMEKLAQKGGIGTNRGGAIQTPVRPDLAEVTEPYKELPYAFAFDFGLQMLESKDDTITWQNYVELQGKTYSDAIDYDILGPTEQNTPIKMGEEIQLEKLSRIIASYKEIGKSYDTLGAGAVTVTADMVAPYGGTQSDLYPYRSAGRSAYDSYVDNDAVAFDLSQLDKAYSYCANYWTGSANPQNKMWLGSFERQRQISAQLSASQRFMESVFTTRDINGVQTVPGRDAGFVTMAYNNIPFIIDGNINVDHTTQIIPDSPKGGDIFLEDLDHIWYKALRPVDFRTTDRYEIYSQLQNRATYFMEGELVSNMWLCHGKITQKA